MDCLFCNKTNIKFDDQQHSFVVISVTTPHRQKWAKMKQTTRPDLNRDPRLGLCNELIADLNLQEEEKNNRTTVSPFTGRQLSPAMGWVCNLRLHSFDQGTNDIAFVVLFENFTTIVHVYYLFTTHKEPADVLQNVTTHPCQLTATSQRVPTWWHDGNASASLVCVFFYCSAVSISPPLFSYLFSNALGAHVDKP